MVKKTGTPPPPPGRPSRPAAARATEGTALMIRGGRRSTQPIRGAAIGAVTAVHMSRRALVLGLFKLLTSESLATAGEETASTLWLKATLPLVITLILTGSVDFLFQWGTPRCMSTYDDTGRRRRVIDVLLPDERKKFTASVTFRAAVWQGLMDTMDASPPVMAGVASEALEVVSLSEEKVIAAHVGLLLAATFLSGVSVNFMQRSMKPETRDILFRGVINALFLAVELFLSDYLQEKMGLEGGVGASLAIKLLLGLSAFSIFSCKGYFDPDARAEWRSPRCYKIDDKEEAPGAAAVASARSSQTWLSNAACCRRVSEAPYEALPE